MRSVTVVFDSLPDLRVQDDYPQGRVFMARARRRARKEARRIVIDQRLYVEGILCPPYEMAIIFFVKESADGLCYSLDDLIGGCKPWIDGIDSTGIMTDDGDIIIARIGKFEGASRDRTIIGNYIAKYTVQFGHICRESPL